MLNISDETQEKKCRLKGIKGSFKQIKTAVKASSFKTQFSTNNRIGFT